MKTFSQGYNYESFMKEYHSDFTNPKSGWVRKVTKDNIKKDGYTCKVWQKKNIVKGMNDWIRCECDMMNIKPYDVIDYYRNPPKNKNSLIKEMYVLEKIDETTEIWYMRLKTPMSSDRDNLLKIVTTTEEDGS